VDATTAVSVTLEPELFHRLEAESRRLHLPLEWLVASLIVDTIDSDVPEPALA
jgi:hypothetical protein